MNTPPTDIANGISWKLPHDSFIGFLCEDKMTLFRNGQPVFHVDKEMCEDLDHYCDSFVKSHTRAKIFHNFNFVLEHRDKVGALFQNRQTSYPASASPSFSFDGGDDVATNLVEPLENIIVAKEVSGFHKGVLSTKANSGDNTEKENNPQFSDYDFERCFIQSVYVERYENTFPFHFYMNEDMETKCSSDTVLLESKKAGKNILSEENGMNAHPADMLGGLSQERRAYKFEKYFGQDPNIDIKFPHCIYSCDKARTTPFVPMFGCMSKEQIYNGTRHMNLYIKGDEGESEKCVILHASHALYDVVLGIASQENKTVIGLGKMKPSVSTILKKKKKEEEEEKGDSMIMDVEEIQIGDVVDITGNDIDDYIDNDDINDSKIRMRKLNAFGFKIAPISRFWNKEVNADIDVCPLICIFAPSSVFKKAVESYEAEIYPMIAMPKNMSMFLEQPLEYYKHGASFGSRSQQEEEEKEEVYESIEEFEQKYMNREAHVKYQLRVCLLAFPKDHATNPKVMCATPW